MSAHNAEHDVSEAISSILAQSYDNLELLVLDDAIQCRTAEIVQAGLDRCIAAVGLAPTLAGGRGFPSHGGIEPDRQRAPALERFDVGWPVPGLLGRRDGSVHATLASSDASLTGFVQQGRSWRQTACHLGTVGSLSCDRPHFLYRIRPLGPVFV